MIELHPPFFMFNPKSYFYGEKLYELINYADQLAATTEVDLLVTVPFAEIKTISEQNKHIIVTAQHMDALLPGKGMGAVLPESIYQAGARACVLNHAERPLTYTVLRQTIQRARELKIFTIACANNLEEAKAVALLRPDAILCEPTAMIGQGEASPESYITETIQSIKTIDPGIYIIQGAGISTRADIINTLRLGSDANGVTSGITENYDPKNSLKVMVEATQSFK